MAAQGAATAPYLVHGKPTDKEIRTMVVKLVADKALDPCYLDNIARVMPHLRSILNIASDALNMYTVQICKAMDALDDGERVFLKENLGLTTAQARKPWSWHLTLFTQVVRLSTFPREMPTVASLANVPPGLINIFYQLLWERPLLPGETRLPQWREVAGVWVRTYVGLAAPWHGWLTKGELKDVPQDVRDSNCDLMANGMPAIVLSAIAKPLFVATKNMETATDGIVTAAVGSLSDTTMKEAKLVSGTMGSSNQSELGANSHAQAVQQERGRVIATFRALREENRTLSDDQVGHTI
jgi:hypothetical protein